MGFFRYEEAATFELVKHLPVHPAVGQWIPCAGVLWRGHFTELRPADEFCSAVKQHSFGWLLGCHRPVDHGVHVVVFGFGLKRKKAGSAVPPALLQAGWLLLF
jgi:hypothetical protein